MARAFDKPEAARRPRLLVRLRACRTGRLQGQRASHRCGLRHQRLRQFREDLVLAYADCQVRGGGPMRALLAMGKGLYRHPRQVTRSTRAARTSEARAAPAMASPMSPAVR